MTEETHFGFETVSPAEKTARVRGVFRSVAGRYDVMNDLMSFGLHRLWKRFAIEVSGVRAGERVLDLAGGTGDLAAAFAERVGERGEVWLADINAAMLDVGRDRLTDRGCTSVRLAQVNAEALPFPDDYFHCVTIAFGLRNVTRMASALTEMLRILKPGGRALVLEFSKPAPPWAPVYDFFSFRVIPALGRRVTGDEASYRYLVESIRRHPDQATLAGMMREAGFERVGYHNLSGGVTALHRGYKF